MTEHHYLAVIGDIRRSRDLPDRSRVQSELESTLEGLNDRLGDDVAARFVVTLGDEFQGLLARPGALLSVLVHMEKGLPQVQFRYGVGWGLVETGFRPTAVGMDGRCFHMAREALAASKDANRWGTVRGFGDAEDAVLTGMLALLGAVREGWTERQALTVALARDHETQREVAAELGVGPSTVSESLASALYVPILEAEEGLAAALKTFGEIPYTGPDSEE